MFVFLCLDNKVILKFYEVEWWYPSMVRSPKQNSAKIVKNGIVGPEILLILIEDGFSVRVVHLA